MRIVVDFPAPFGPRKPVTLPGRTTNETSSTAVLGPYCLERCSTSITAATLRAGAGRPRPPQGGDGLHRSGDLADPAPVCHRVDMLSPQSLSEVDRRTVAAWAADCADRVLPLFEAEAPGDDRPRDAIARARAFASGDLDAAGEIRRRFVAGRAASAVSTPAAVAAARAAAQASGVAHMGAHALGAAAYAAKAAGLASSDPAHTTADELRWQLDRMSGAVRAALRQLPVIGSDRSGPLGAGLLASGALGENIRALQDVLGGATLAP